MKKRLAVLALTCVCMMATACGTASKTTQPTTQVAKAEQGNNGQTEQAKSKTAETTTEEKTTTTAKAPKYIFLCIGDGMSYPQLQLTNYYLNAKDQSKAQTVTVEGIEKQELVSEKKLNMMQLPVTGSVQTYDSTSFAPDSASTATSIATGNKTWSGSINVSTDFSQKYETIAEKLKKQLDYKIGVISSVNINHATPAAFYAHQNSRNNYYEIGEELIASNFDYFAGGSIKKATGDKKDKEDLHELAVKAGCKVIKTQQEAKALKPEDGKAIEFYHEHPEETLILVTGDHETGGLTIGYAGTDYDTFLKNFENQKISYAKFDEEYVKKYRKEKTPFETVMQDVTELFGLQAPIQENSETTTKDSADGYPQQDDKGSLVMTDYEYQLLQQAYETSLARTGEEKEFGQEEYIRYGSYGPFSVTITHILNNKSGINFGSYAHTGLPVEMLAQGVGAESFVGYYDNTDIYKKLATLTGVK